MAETGISDEALAAKVGVGRTAISRIRRGLRRPSFQVAEAISRATDFAVTPNDLSEIPELQTKDAA